MPSLPRSARRARPGRSTCIVVAGALAVLGLVSVALVFVRLPGAVADVNPGAGVEVPADELQMIDAAAPSCPALTPPRLAGQLMANSGFNPNATRAGGGSGVAGLTEPAWRQWSPRPGAQRSSIQDNIVALAHQMCEFVGELRPAKIAGDQWRLALAAFAVGAPPVRLAGGVPTGAAADYVAKVELYTNWYAQQRQFGGAGDPSPSAAPSPSGSPAAAKPVPDEYVNLVLAAGSVCAPVTPARIAAQLMAASGFNPNKLSSSGQEGIAQFRPQEWAQYNVRPLATPWDPHEAVPVLGRAMCDLVSQVSTTSPQTDTYAGALTAFEWGVTGVAQAGGVPADPDRSFIAAVNAYLPRYTADKRLNPAAPPASPHPPSRAPSSPPAGPSPSPTRPAPPAPGTRSAYTGIQAENFTAQSGTQAEACSDVFGGQDMGYLAPGDWLAYDKVDFGSAGASRFLVRFASDLRAGMSGLVELRIDAVGNTPVGSAAVGGTGGWQTWITIPANLTKVTGVHSVYLTFTSSSGWEIGNINWFIFQH